jgi:hypothetical protein
MNNSLKHPYFHHKHDLNFIKRFDIRVGSLPRGYEKQP